MQFNVIQCKRRTAGNITEQYRHGAAKNVIVTSELSPENVLLVAAKSTFTFLFQFQTVKELNPQIIISYFQT